MKKLATLLIAAGLVMGAAAPSANAGDVKLFGQMQHQFMTGNTWGTGGLYQPLKFGSKIDMGFQYIASESLSGTVILRAGHGDANDYWAEWGQGPKMFSQKIDPNNGASRFYVKNAYLDWLIPGTRVAVRMGLQSLTTPAWCNGPTIVAGAADMAGVSVNVPVNDSFNFTVAWFRQAGANNLAVPGTAYWGHNFGRNKFYAVATYRGNGLTIQPYAQYDRIGSDGTLGLEPAYMWNIGIGGQYVFNPFVFEFNAAYGQEKNPNGSAYKWTNANGSNVNNVTGKRKGFVLKANAGYKTAWGTPTLDLWYYSGDKQKEANYSGQMPHDGGSNNVALLRTNRSMFLGDGVGNPRVMGTTGVALSWKNLSFVKGLNHTAIVSYWRGTNNVRLNGADRAKYGDFGYMTTKDRYIEADLINTYQIYPQLQFGLELAYGWAKFKMYDGAKWVKDEAIKNGWRISGGFTYNF